MRRRLFNLAAGSSLLLGIAVAIVWARSYSVADSYLFFWGGRSDVPPWSANLVGPTLDARHFEGRLMVIYAPFDSILPARYGWRHTEHRGRSTIVLGLRQDPFSSDRALSRGAFGFRWHSSLAIVNPPTWQRFVQIPDYAFALLAAILPSAWFIDRVRRRVSIRRGRCGNCGYDLRASPARCPECGAPCGPASAGQPLVPSPGTPGEG
jgi:hypothetical protein